MPVKNMCITLSPKAQRELSERSRKLNLSKSAYLELLVYLDLEKYDKRELMLLRAEAIDRRSTDRGEDHFVPMESEEAAHAISAEMLMENEDTLPKLPKKGLAKEIADKIVQETVSKQAEIKDGVGVAIDRAIEEQKPQPEPVEEETPDVEEEPQPQETPQLEPQAEPEPVEEEVPEVKEEPTYDFLKPKKKRINTM